MSDVATITADQLAVARGGPAPPVVLDVREPWEVAIAALPGSLVIPMNQIPQRLGDIPRDRPVAVICHAGVRSHHVTQFLQAQGFQDVANVVGGIDAWARTQDPSMDRY